MGTFAGILKTEGAKIPEGKIGEFEKKLERLFQAGGMMEMSYVSMFGIEIETIKKVSMGSDGMNCTYNYFEDDSWEDAGYNRKEHRVYSNKVGWSKFNAVVRAAYILEAMYLDGPAAAKVNGRPVDPEWPSKWIAGLFGEPVTDKGAGPWDVYELLRRSEDSDLTEADWRELVEPVISYADGRAGGLEFLSAAIVDMGTTDFAKENEKPEEGSTGWLVGGLRNVLHRFHCPENGDAGKAGTAMELLGEYYGTDISTKELERKCKDAGLQLFGAVTASMDMPPVVVKLIAEEFGLDFWELWDGIKDIVKNGGRHVSGEQWEKPLEPISTMEYLNLREDDMLPYWDGTDSVQFSEGMEQWFAKMREDYDAVMESEESLGKGSPVRWVLGLAEYASKEYGHIYVFDDFLNETISNLGDRRYLALWEVYSRMLHDPEMQEAGSVIFEEQESAEGFRYWWETRRPLKYSWATLDPREKENKARVTLRNYMALVGNRKLREKVFGF